MTADVQTMTVHYMDGYRPLLIVLQEALDQAQAGKGKERHAQGDTPFVRQPICEIGRMVGVGYNAGQAMKKTQEATRLPAERAVAECLGAINYLAAMVILIREQSQDELTLGAVVGKSTS